MKNNKEFCSENIPQIFKMLKKLENGAENNWWNLLKNDKDVYIDIRKDNTINIYHNGGSILRIKGPQSAEIHYKYLPICEESKYATISFSGENIDLKNNTKNFLTENVKKGLNNLNRDTIKKIKTLIEKKYPSNSEKGIQGGYATNYDNEQYGFFIDTEYADLSTNARIDLIYIDYHNCAEPILYFVELKTRIDNRLWQEKKEVEFIEKSDEIDEEDDVEKTNGKSKKPKKEKEDICIQLKKYYKLINEKGGDLTKYYRNVYKIKEYLGILPKKIKDKNIDIDNLKINPLPILLIGDATRNFINETDESVTQAANKLNNKVKDCVCMVIYRGIGTKTLNIHNKNDKHIFRFNEDK